MGNEQARFVALAIIPKVTSSISIPCQVWIIKEVVTDHLAGRGKATSRALLGMGCIDMMASFGWFLSTWAAPSDAEGVPFASGNQASCAFQGFLLQIAIGAPMYNCALSLYYLLSIRHGWKDDRLRRVEYALHAFILTFAFGTGFGLIPVGVYNHIGAVCWVIGKPQGCGHSNYNPGDETCERGDNAWIYGISLFYGPLWICILLTTMAMVLIHRKVRDTERKTRRYSGTTARRTNDVFLQALLYTVAFYVAWMPSTIWSITHWFDTPMYWLDVLATLCEPSQGLLNMLVFVRPRRDLRRKLRRDVLMVLSCGLVQVEAATTSGGPSSTTQHRSSGEHLSDARRNRVSLMNMHSTGHSRTEDNLEMVCQKAKFEHGFRTSFDVQSSFSVSEDNFAENYSSPSERRSVSSEDEEEKKSVSVERKTSVTFRDEQKLDDIDEAISVDDDDISSTDEIMSRTNSGNS